jgi:hypothetical protein
LYSLLQILEASIHFHWTYLIFSHTKIISKLNYLWMNSFIAQWLFYSFLIHLIVRLITSFLILNSIILYHLNFSHLRITRSIGSLSSFIAPLLVIDTSLSKFIVFIISPSYIFLHFHNYIYYFLTFGSLPLIFLVWTSRSLLNLSNHHYEVMVVFLASDQSIPVYYLIN